MIFPAFTLKLPLWVESYLEELDKDWTQVEERMQFVIELARLNIEHGTGGPFAAAIFEMKTNRLIAPGVNLVISSSCSAAHAEITAIIIAQQVVGHYDLCAAGNHTYEMVTSTEPCAMCLGAVCWAGLRKLVCGAREEDAQLIGFDEGPKPLGWQALLEQRGIQVLRDVERRKAASILNLYAEQGGLIYNPERGL